MTSGDRPLLVPRGNRDEGPIQVRHDGIRPCRVCAAGTGERGEQEVGVRAHCRTDRLRRDDRSESSPSASSPWRFCARRGSATTHSSPCARRSTSPTDGVRVQRDRGCAGLHAPALVPSLGGHRHDQPVDPRDPRRQRGLHRHCGRAPRWRAVRREDHPRDRPAPAVECLHRVRDLRPGEPARLPAGRPPDGVTLALDRAPAGRHWRTRRRSAWSRRRDPDPDGPRAVARPRGRAAVFRTAQPTKSRGVAATAALLPLAVWFTWSWATYSALLPNTFLAKRTSTSRRSSSSSRAFGTCGSPSSTIPSRSSRCCSVPGWRSPSDEERRESGRRGCSLYVGYVVWIGGDFMAGRFLAVPVYVAVFLLAVVSQDLPRKGRRARHPPRRRRRRIVAVLLMALVGGDTPTSVANPQARDGRLTRTSTRASVMSVGCDVANGSRWRGSSTTSPSPSSRRTSCPSATAPVSTARCATSTRRRRSGPRPDDFTLPSEVGVFCGFLGTIGMATGPITHLVDSCALTDRFLAGAPFTAGQFSWKPGHFEREIPEGYVEAVAIVTPAGSLIRRERFT